VSVDLFNKGLQFSESVGNRVGKVYLHVLFVKVEFELQLIHFQLASVSAQSLHKTHLKTSVLLPLFAITLFLLLFSIFVL